MEKIEVYEVGPRDGFQSISEYIPLDKKLKIIEYIYLAGISNIQITSFVSPKAVPQMKDAKELSTICLEKFPDISPFALVPNTKGAENAWEVGIRNVSYVVSLSESHNKANIRRTHEESFNEYLNIKEKLPDLNICLDLATTFGCPFEGGKNANQVVDFLDRYIKNGIDTVNLCDTIGIANPKQVREVIIAVQNAFPDIELQVHIHDTRNMGMVNTLAAIEKGVKKVQTTLGGLGGCPFAPGASGNLATEDLVYMLMEMGYDTGIDLNKLLFAARYQEKVIPNGNFSGHLFKINDNAKEEK